MVNEILKAQGIVVSKSIEDFTDKRTSQASDFINQLQHMIKKQSFKCPKNKVESSNDQALKLQSKKSKSLEASVPSDLSPAYAIDRLGYAINRSLQLLKFSAHPIRVLKTIKGGFVSD